MAEVDFKKQKLEYVLVGALVFVALFIGLSRFKGKAKDDEVFSRSRYNHGLKEAEELDKQDPYMEKPVLYSINAARLPFKSPLDSLAEESTGIEEDIKLPPIVLQGIVWNSHRPQVVIDNKIYDIYDTIGIGQGEDKLVFTITDITREGMSLKYKRKEYLIRAIPE